MNKLILLLCIPFIGLAQTDYELAFNSATLDYVEISNASSVIANKTEFTISGWINPQMDASHSGFFGFRNNSDADFFLLQLQNSTNVEARFRNSAGVNFDVVANSILDIGQWQHLAFTYDGSYIKLYKNGSMVDSTAANGTITNPFQSFKIGSLDYQTSSFPMQGSADEVRLWDAALSESTINSWMCSAIDLTHPNYSSLQGYWRLNDGVGTTATDLSVNGNNGMLNNNPTWQVTTTCFGSTTPPLTYVPDDNFETYLEANGMGDGIALNDYVFTSNINSITSLYILNLSISNLTGIEDFTSLEELYCFDNQLTILDVSSNTALTDLSCHDNQLTSIDVSNNLSLSDLRCGNNQLTNLDVSNNTSLTLLFCYSNQLTILDLNNNTNLTFLACVDNQLTNLDLSQNTSLGNLHCSENQLTNLNLINHTVLTSLQCYDNQLTMLDVSANTVLTDLNCINNQLTSLDVKNGNNTNMSLYCSSNNQLLCVTVDDPVWSTTYWTVGSGMIDAQHYFSNDCSLTAIQEDSTNKELLKVTDLLGRETKGTKNEPLLYIYDDGTVKKKIIIE